MPVTACGGRPGDRTFFLSSRIRLAENRIGSAMGRLFFSAVPRSVSGGPETSILANFHSQAREEIGHPANQSFHPRKRRERSSTRPRLRQSQSVRARLRPPGRDRHQFRRRSRRGSAVYWMSRNPRPALQRTRCLPRPNPSIIALPCQPTLRCRNGPKAIFRLP